MTYIQATLAALAWLGSVVAVTAAAGGVVWAIWCALPEWVKNKMFE